MDHFQKYLKYKNKYLSIKYNKNAKSQSQSQLQLQLQSQSQLQLQLGGYLTAEEKQILERAGFEKKVIDSLEMQHTEKSYIDGLIAEARKAIQSGKPAYEAQLDPNFELKQAEKSLAELTEKYKIFTEANQKELLSLNDRGLNFTSAQLKMLYDRGWSVDEIIETGLQITPSLRERIITDIQQLPIVPRPNIKAIQDEIEDKRYYISLIRARM